MFNFYQHLGFNNPYYYVKNGKFLIQKSFNKAVKRYGENLTFDVTSAIEILNKHYPFADRTMANEIKKTPWQAKPNENLTEWDYSQIPQHGKKVITEKEIAEILFQKMKEEILIYVVDKEKIGVLLSGGMDSRMVAGVLDFLVKSNTIKNITVTGITWGNDNSRDVIYAKEIAQRLGWEWKHYKITAADFLNNIEETAIQGCEFSPLHLHALPQIKKDNLWEVILGGSYGDSIGRAEYGGVRMENVKPLSDGVENIAALINDEIYNIYFPEVSNDLKKYHQLFPKNEIYMQNELDYQIHYTRRMLNQSMEMIAEKMEFYQVFTHPATFGFMWSIAPDKRNDLVYLELMNKFSTDLNDIPWARTGLPYGETEGKPDKYSSRHHSYVEIIQGDAFFKIKKLLLSERLYELGIFNKEAVLILLDLVEKKPFNSMHYLYQLAWIASVSRMLEIYSFSNSHRVREQNISRNKLKHRILKEYLPRYYRNRIGHYLRKFKLLK